MSGAPGPTSSPLNGPLREANGERIALVERYTILLVNADQWIAYTESQSVRMRGLSARVRSFLRLSPRSWVLVLTLVGALFALLSAAPVAALVSAAPVYTDHAAPVCMWVLCTRPVPAFAHQRCVCVCCSPHPYAPVMRSSALHLCICVPASAPMYARTRSSSQCDEAMHTHCRFNICWYVPCGLTVCGPFRARLRTYWHPSVPAFAPVRLYLRRLSALVCVLRRAFVYAFAAN
ncbi:hypothetical protein B0H13DRAFT_2388829 [Mycena leptocephala]|nr:hypothetical protein B0H13DRAFT_2388829 [Mycena leptocephala]